MPGMTQRTDWELYRIMIGDALNSTRDQKIEAAREWMARYPDGMVDAAVSADRLARRLTTQAG